MNPPNVEYANALQNAKAFIKDSIKNLNSEIDNISMELQADDANYSKRIKELDSILRGVRKGSIKDVSESQVRKAIDDYKERHEITQANYVHYISEMNDEIKDLKDDIKNVQDEYVQALDQYVHNEQVEEKYESAVNREKHYFEELYPSMAKKTTDMVPPNVKRAMIDEKLYGPPTPKRSTPFDVLNRPTRSIEGKKVRTAKKVESVLTPSQQLQIEVARQKILDEQMALQQRDVIVQQQQASAAQIPVLLNVNEDQQRLDIQAKERQLDKQYTQERVNRGTVQTLGEHMFSTKRKKPLSIEEETIFSSTKSKKPIEEETVFSSTKREKPLPIEEETVFSSKLPVIVERYQVYDQASDSMVDREYKSVIFERFVDDGTAVHDRVENKRIDYQPTYSETIFSTKKINPPVQPYDSDDTFSSVETETEPSASEKSDNYPEPVDYANAVPDFTERKYSVKKDFERIKNYASQKKEDIGDWVRKTFKVPFDSGEEILSEEEWLSDNPEEFYQSNDPTFEVPTKYSSNVPLLSRIGHKMDTIKEYLKFLFRLNSKDGAPFEQGDLMREPRWYENIHNKVVQWFSDVMGRLPKNAQELGEAINIDLSGKGKRVISDNSWFSRATDIFPSGSEVIKGIVGVIKKEGPGIAKALLVGALLALGTIAANKAYNYIFPSKPTEITHKHLLPKDIPILSKNDLKMLMELLKKPERPGIDHSMYVKNKIDNLLKAKIEYNWDWEGYERNRLVPSTRFGY